MNINQATDVTDEISKEIDDIFSYHSWDAMKVESGRRVREALSNAMKVIIDNVPPSPDRTVAIRKIREARMDCNSAITHEGKY